MEKAAGGSVSDKAETSTKFGSKRKTGGDSAETNLIFGSEG
jgi:hypothetical protein